MSVGAPGQVRPALERINVYPAVGGKVRDVLVVDNQLVRKGDVLLVVDSAALDAQIAQKESQRMENHRAIKDLDVLVSAIVLAANKQDGRDPFTFLSSASILHELPAKLATPQYIRSYQVFVSDAQRLILQRNKSQQELLRQAALHARGLISDSAYEQTKYALEATERDLDLSVQQSLSRWQLEQVERSLRAGELDSEAQQLAQQRDLYTVRASVDGTAIGFVGLHAGVFIPAGERLGEISPGGDLQADVFISPRDIGFVEKGQAVQLQVDAFPYTEWGMVKGRVRDISQDFIQVGQQIAFKAVIDLESTELRSGAGVLVDVRRGMTVNARFVLKERTLFSLLYGKMSESLDPRSKLKT